MPENSMQILAQAIAAGSSTTPEQMSQAIKGLFGDYFAKTSVRGLEDEKPAFMRNAYVKGEETDMVCYAGLINPDNPRSGPYGGMSLVWFPTEQGCLIGFVTGTRGLSPDEGILTRPGHKRRIGSLRQYVVGLGVDAWARQDPATVGVTAPETVSKQFSDWETVFKRYGNELYCVARVPKDDPDKALTVVTAFVNLYGHERGWKVLKETKGEFDNFIKGLRKQWLATPCKNEIIKLLRTRRFVVLEGPPGTGKSRLGRMILDEDFKGNGLMIQFHPSTTYEDFVVGLSPDVDKEALRFGTRRGHLMEAAQIARKDDALLVIDEINRADLGRVLGEAIYLFEAEKGDGRSVRLPYKIDGEEFFSLPTRLHVLATMNTADRSVARMDLAIRRRFAFVTMMPDPSVVENTSTRTGSGFFEDLSDVFLEFAPDDALSLLPGHSYFIAKDESELKDRMRYELLPLLDEYIREGYLGPAGGALYAVRNKIADAIQAETP